ncbi:hypothetical protein ATK36_1244 [Amycolatopsis sulphurea]|uniref:DUF2637 domain-containing protein n=1 Tax=Amycolatopsis sulphurea TaxID=76022 RepID=A0A2A9FK08_9PSEU|nr:hypothetical protein [Amycolatopsis sulphurea]PFG51081.1 hypothetical protein ATK36_6354 [Amycolatopsis sulphurea]PFG57648.1 hypothetical protein ATK36_1244 [Amycolatopsis sulphurea]
MFRKSAPKSAARPVSRRVRTLETQLTEAHDVHRLATDPLLGAVTADRFRTSITRTMWFFLTVGLGFTTTGVHDFLAGRLTATDPLWWGAWLAEPALAGILVTLLRWEAAMLAADIPVTDKPVTHLKRLLLAATFAANVWAALTPATGGISQGSVFFHIVIPLVVYLLAEVMPIIQQRCTQARNDALTTPPATTHPAPPPPPAAAEPVTPQPVPAPAPVKPTPTPTSAPAPAPAPAGSVLASLPASIRTTITDITADAHTAGRPVTPADLSARVTLPAGMLASLADELNTTVNHHKVTT